MRQSITHFVFAICLVTAGHNSFAAEPGDAAACVAIPSNRERLKCYDASAGQGQNNSVTEPLQQLGSIPTPNPSLPSSAPPTALSVRWELDPETKQGPWVVRPHQPLFLLPVRYSSNPNETPQSPSHPLSTTVPLDNTEAEFQLSFKFKAFENLIGNRADLWIGYTQQSQWQVYNGDNSRPFRETNYQPEMFLLFPAHYELLGLTSRFISLGLVHQSNGRSDPLSRSWNRVYAQFGLERGNLSLLARPWYRLKEDAANDDNADITRYLGYGDVTAIYQWGQQQFSLLGRLNGGIGAAQATWSFPIHRRLKGYVKLFLGYGETLIDYNWSQSSIGVGIALADWQ